MMINDEIVAPTVEETLTTSVTTSETAVASAPASDQPAAPVAADDLNLFEAEMAKLDQEDAARKSGQVTRRINKGDRIEATVILVEPTRVFVDLGMKSEGVIPLGELTEDNVETAVGLVNVGDKVTVIVLRTDGGDGNPLVSKKKADFDENWNKIIQAFQDQTMLMANVIDRVKGGLVVDVGVRGFVPATHVGNGKLRNIDKYVGETLELKVIEVDKERKKVVLSNRAAEEIKREGKRDELFGKVNPGEILDGTVRRLTEYGAFIDLGGIDGLLHISEMSWMRISHPKEVLKDGQQIKVMVLRLDKEAGKISLGLRQVMPDPWNLIKENYKIGQKFNGAITRMVQSGAFVRLPEGAEAFLPLSEISTKRITKPQDELTENQEVELTIIDLRPDERRMVLSLRNGAPSENQVGFGFGAQEANNDFSDRSKRPTGGKKPSGPRGKKGGRDDFEGGGGGSRSGGGGATIGERLGMLKGFHFRSEEEATPAVEAPAEAKAEAKAATKVEAKVEAKAAAKED